MRTRILAGLLAVAACGDDGGSATIDAAVVADARPPDAKSLDAPIDAAPSCTDHVVLYLNATGGDYMPGSDDSRTNKSSILSQATTLAAYPNADFADVQACITTALAGLPIDVTATDPGTAPHVELVFTTRVPGFPNTPGLAAQSCPSGGHGQPNAIAFIAGQVGTGANYHCGVALGLYGLVNRLSYTGDATDWMSFDVCAGGAAACSYKNASETCTGGDCLCSGAATENPASDLLAALPCQ